MTKKIDRLTASQLIGRPICLFKTQYVQEYVEGLRRAFQGRFRAIERKY